ncbi:MAG: ImmA/IrrE family metallo-endopeptidase [Bacteroidota bacterium]
MRKNRTLDIEIEKKAIFFRQKTGLSSTEPIRLKSLLLKLNVLTLFKPLSGNFSGMAVKVGDRNRFMMVNCDQSIGKQHFTIGHELYHLFIQENFKSQQCYTGVFDKKDIEEYKADLFSAFLLLPEEGIKQMIPDGESKLSLQTILKIEQYYAVSRRALLYRLLNLDFINDAEVDLHTDNVKRGAAENGYGIDLYAPGNKGEIIGDYGVVARCLLDTEKISESHYLELMDAIGINPLAVEGEVENGKE